MQNKSPNIITANIKDAPLIAVLASQTEMNNKELLVHTLSKPKVGTDQPSEFTAGADSQVPLIKTDTALMSLRASNFDTPAAVGEPIDNSLQAKANSIKIRLVEGERKFGKKSKATLVVDQIAIADDGEGMSNEVLERSLVLGFSTRYDNRSGMGRFGVGSTLAGISQAKRIELYTRNQRSGSYHYSYIDLDEIAAGQQSHMPKPVVREIPEQFAKMMGDGTGTLVVWSKCDKLVQGEDGTVHDLNSVRSELIEWLSRTYRYFINSGLHLELDGKTIEPYDSLYLMDVPRFPNEPKAELLLDETFEWTVPSDPTRTSPVRVRLTLLPKEWRLKRGWGASTHKPTRERRVDTNEGFSIMRANREIFYGISPRFYPSAVQDIDRWHGIEISFEPDLDECFRVRNVKKGAEPVESLREKLKNLLAPAIKVARRRIQTTYDEEDSKEKSKAGVHEEAENIGAQAEKTAPKARSGQTTTPEARDAVIDGVAAEAAQSGVDEETKKANAEAIKTRLKTLPFSIVDSQWSGKDFIEIEHLGANIIIKLNNKHPFFTRIYSPVSKAAGVLKEQDGDAPIKVSEEELQKVARSVHVGLDLLIMAYAKAESMSENAEEDFGNLRTQWGMFLYNLVQQMPELK